MQTVDEIVAAILEREGGYVDDPDDPGGPTNRGVTLATLRRLGVDLDGDGDSDRDDLRRLSAEQAGEIFLRHYYRRPRIDELPASLRASVFDMYVNAGANAVKILQRLLRQMGHPLAVDGVIGPRTLAAARGAEAEAGAFLADAYGIARRNYYFEIAERRPASRKYVRRRDGGKGGWIRRAEAFISPRYHLDQAAFSARVARWG